MNSTKLQVSHRLMIVRLHLLDGISISGSQVLVPTKLISKTIQLSQKTSTRRLISYIASWIRLLTSPRRSSPAGSHYGECFSQGNKIRPSSWLLSYQMLKAKIIWKLLFLTSTFWLCCTVSAATDCLARRTLTWVSHRLSVTALQILSSRRLAKTVICAWVYIFTRVAPELHLHTRRGTKYQGYPITLACHSLCLIDLGSSAYHMWSRGRHVHY